MDVVGKPSEAAIESTLYSSSEFVFFLSRIDLVHKEKIILGLISSTGRSQVSTVIDSRTVQVVHTVIG